MDQSPAAAALQLAVKVRALIKAVATGDTETVINLLDGGIPINAKDDKGMSLLHEAAAGGHVTTMRLLIRRGCSVDSVDDIGFTPLHYAALMGETKTVRELIRNGADKSVVAGEFGTPLHQATIEGHAETVVAMLEEGCPFDVVNSAKSTVLHWAAQCGNLALVRELAGRGCDVNAVKANGSTPLHDASGHGCFEVVMELICRGSDLNAENVDGDTPLHAASKRGHIEVIRELVSRGCNVNAVDADGCTPLHHAAGRGRTKAVDELLVLGAIKSVAAGVHGTPLHRATANGHVETVEALLKHESCEKKLTNHKVTPLKGQELKYNEISSCNACSFGQTPVMWAIRHGQMNVFKLLTSKGGAVHDRDSHNVSTFEHCFVGGNANRLSQFCEAYGIRSSGEGLRGDLASVITHGLVDAHKVLCLCAISGDSLFLDDQFIELVASGDCIMPAAVRCTKYYYDKGVSFLDQLRISNENALNPLHVCLLSLKCLNMGFAGYTVQIGAKDHSSFITKLLSHPVLKETVNEHFPNGLSPLDLARQFKLHKIAALIEGAGGGPGVWADIPQEIEARHPLALAQLKEDYASIKAIAEDSEHGYDFVRQIFFSVLRRPLCDRPSLLSAKQLDKENVLRQKPKSAKVARLILSQVSTQNWKLVGLLLLEDVTDSEKTLNAISHQFSDDRNRFLETLSYWLEHGSSVTWKTLLDVLGHFETKHTIDELTEKIASELGGAIQVSLQLPGPSVSSSNRTAELNWRPGNRWKTSDETGEEEGVHLQRKRSPEGDTQDYSPTKTVARCALTESGRTVKVMSVTSSAQVASGGAVDAERNPLVCEGSLLHSKPTMLELCGYVVRRVAARWYKLGLTLRVQDYLLDNITVTERGEVEACCTDMLKRWLRGEPDTGGVERSWSTLLGAVQRCLGPEAASSIAGALQAAQSLSHSS